MDAMYSLTWPKQYPLQTQPNTNHLTNTNHKTTSSKSKTPQWTRFSTIMDQHYVHPSLTIPHLTLQTWDKDIITNVLAIEIHPPLAQIKWPRRKPPNHLVTWKNTLVMGPMLHKHHHSHTPPYPPPPRLLKLKFYSYLIDTSNQVP